jgi:hypothetical protein
MATLDPQRDLSRHAATHLTLVSHFTHKWLFYSDVNSFRLEKKARLRPHSYDNILKGQAIRNVTETPSNDECDFVRYVIAKIP